MAPRPISPRILYRPICSMSLVFSLRPRTCHAQNTKAAELPRRPCANHMRGKALLGLVGAFVGDTLSLQLFRFESLLNPIISFLNVLRIAFLGVGQVGAFTGQ